MLNPKSQFCKCACTVLAAGVVAGLVVHAPDCPQGLRLVCPIAMKEQPHGPHEDRTAPVRGSFNVFVSSAASGTTTGYG
jgi:hypothetical protein